MKPVDWFILGARLFGLWVASNGVSGLSTYAYYKLDFQPLTPLTNEGAFKSYLWIAASDFALAGYLLLGTRHLAGLCYGKPSSSDDPTESDQDAIPAKPEEPPS